MQILLDTITPSEGDIGASAYGVFDFVVGTDPINPIPPVNPVPMPPALLLFLTGIIGLGITRCNR